MFGKLDRQRVSIVALTVALGLGFGGRAGGAEPENASPPFPTAKAIRSAAERALPMLETGVAGYALERDCFSCHHQAVPVLALTLADQRGFAVDPEVIQDALELTHADLDSARESYEQGRGQPGGVTRAGYALWTLELGGWEPDEATSAVVEYLLQRHADTDHWTTTATRPPSEASPWTSTAVALRGLKAFGTDEHQQRITDRVATVKPWLAQTPVADTEDHVFRLWALSLAGACDEQLQEAADAVLQTQNDDGGWSQTDALESDAYATGSALVALHLATGLPTEHPAYQRGLAFLIHDQHDDGSWHVNSRSRPFQTYFESGFPHGPDQFISIAASGWATAALVLACPGSP